MNMKPVIQWPCPVCGHDSFGEPPGSYVICDICNWEDDPVQIKHPRMRGGANSGSIFDYQRDSDTWRMDESIARDPDWRPLRLDEAPLPSGEVGAIDYKLDFYGDSEPYYWRNNTSRTSRSTTTA